MPLGDSNMIAAVAVVKVRRMNFLHDVPIWYGAGRYRWTEEVFRVGNGHARAAVSLAYQRKVTQVRLAMSDRHKLLVGLSC